MTDDAEAAGEPEIAVEVVYPDRIAPGDGREEHLQLGIGQRSFFFLQRPTLLRVAASHANSVTAQRHLRRVVLSRRRLPSTSWLGRETQCSTDDVSDDPPTTPEQVLQGDRGSKT